MHRIKKKHCWQNAITLQIRRYYPYSHIYGTHQKLGREKKAGSHSIEILSPHPFLDLRVSHETE